VDQLFDPRPYPDFRGGTFTISTATLRPQRATNLEVGAAGRSLVTWSVVAYRMAVEDEIDFDIRTFSYGNIGRSRHTGLELEGSRRVAGWFQPSVEYALTRVTDAESGLQLKNVPRRTFVAATTMDLPWRLGAYVRYRRATGAFFDDDNRVSIHGPATVDVRVRRTIGGQTLFVDAVNLFDNRYEEFGYTLTDFAGRVVPYAYAGAPRALRAGVSLAVGGKKPGNP
jgi:outer membrane cobalamin receptor